MASGVQRSTHKLSCSKLPLITEKSLVSPVSSARSVQEEWMLNTRQRLDKKIAESSGNETDEEQLSSIADELNAIVHEIVTLFVTALQKDDRKSWVNLRDALIQSKPYKVYLNGNQKIIHYLERAKCHVQVHKERLFDLNIYDTLIKVFDKDIMMIQEKDARPKRLYCPPTPPRSIAPPILRKPSVKSLMPDGKDPFTLERSDDVARQKPKLLTFGDLTASMADVAFETATREAIWNACLGTTARALNVDIPNEQGDSVDFEDKEVIEEEACQDEELTEISVEDEEHDATPLNGREAVEYFTKCYHTGKIKHMYFNVAPSRVYQPYQLVAVPKNKANKEHYVFSTFGVLHVHPDQSSTNKSLAEWQKDAVLFAAITKIPFFKNFLQRKMFNRWHTNVHFTDYARIRHGVHSDLLHAIPSFGAALLQISKLCNELLQLKLLPLDTNKTYHLPQFENTLNYMNRQGEKILERFYRFSKIVMDTTAEESFKKLRHCDKQFQHKTYFSKDSLYLQRKKHEQRAANLMKAKDEANRLGNLVKLVDQMLLSHLIQCVRNNVSIFVHQALKPDTPPSRDGFFQASLIFNNEGVLGLSPNEIDFKKALKRVFEDLPTFLCAAALPIDGSLSIRIPDDIVALDSLKDSIEMTPRSFSTNHQMMVSLMKDPKKRKPESSVQSLSSLDGTPHTRKAMKDMASFIHEPSLPRDKTPSKSDDFFGVASPDIMLVDSSENFEASIQKFNNHHRPLTKGNLSEKLNTDKAYVEAFEIHEILMQEAIDEVNEFCQKNEWINEIHQFCMKWSEESVNQYKGEAAFTLEQKLNEIRQWSERVRNFERSYSTENGIFYVDCAGIQNSLLPKLNAIFKELCLFIAGESWNLAKSFNGEMTAVLELLKKKDTDIAQFAENAKTVAKCKKSLPRYQQKMDYIKSLYEVIRMCFRAPTPEEEAVEEKILANWESFLFHMQDAMEFVNTQTPIMTQTLDENYHMPPTTWGNERQSSSLSGTGSQSHAQYGKHEKRARQICQEATSGRFLDPNQPPTETLEAITKLQREFYDILGRVEKASVWREAITGDGYDLTSYKKMCVKIDIRQEVWKLYEVSTHMIKEWKQSLFVKFNAKKAMSKVADWLAANGQIKAHLPRGDSVLGAWFKVLSEFKTELPMLHKLASEALKPRHWKAIFLSMGQQYDPDYPFTVEELMAFHLSQNSQIITTVHSAALAEHSIEIKLEKIKKLWDTKVFKLAKHIPESIIKNGDSGSVASSPSKRAGRYDKVRLGRQLPKFLDLRNQDLYILIEVEEIKYLLEDSRVTVETMLASPYIADLKEDVVKLSEALVQFEEIVDLWVNAQNKWLYFLKIFEDSDMYRQLGDLSQQFEEIHKKFLEIMHAVIQEPKVSAMLNKHRGEKGYRVHQGSRLVQTLHALIKDEEGLQCQLLEFLDRARHQFTRLYFLSDQDLVNMLSVSRNPKALLPFARKCFNGIEQLHFTLPVEADNGNTALDFALNADKLEVTKLVGYAGEELQLHSQLLATTDATRWLATLETYMKETLLTMMELCLQSRLEDSSTKCSQLMQEIRDLESKERNRLTDSKQRHSCSRPETCQISIAELKKDIDFSFEHYMLRFPAQCILTTEAVIWERNVFKALEKSDKDTLKKESSQLTSHIDQCVCILKENFLQSDSSSVRRRLHVLIGCIINQAIYHREIIQNLLKNSSLTDAAFDWLKVVKYHMDINTVLRAKTEAEDNEEFEIPVPKSSGRRRVKTAGDKRSTTSVTLTHRPQSAPGPASVKRGFTTISTGYQFGPCTVSQMGSTFAYDYEYYGPAERLALTPLTERAYLSLSMSLKNFQCGTLLGPAGVGKSETIKDLAKAMGRNLVIFNCNKGLSLAVMNQYLNGMVQSGTWGLFDDLHTVSQGVLSVFGQQIEYLSSALRVLDASSDNQYGIRGQPRFDKKMTSRSGEKKIRRNSLTTLHSLPLDIGRSDVGLERQATVPHGFNEDGLITYFEDSWVKERERRHSIEKEIEIKESELYKSMRPPPLFYEHVTLSRKRKQDFRDLIPSYVPYKQAFLGNVLHNGRLIKANAHFGCFVTLTSMPSLNNIPHNLKLCMRPFSIAVPDIRVIAEVILFCNGFNDCKNLARKLSIFFELARTQIPGKREYQLGLRAMKSILHLAAKYLRQYQHDMMLQELQAKDSLAVESSSDSQTPLSMSPGPDLSSKAGEEESVIKALTFLLGARMSCAEDRTLLKNLLRDVFPNSARPKSGLQKYSSNLIKSVEDQLRQESLVPTEEMVTKILQLYTALELKQGVFLIGPSGSGKTTSYKILAKVLNVMHSKQYEVITDTDVLPDRPIEILKSRKLKILRDSEQRPEVASISSKWQSLKSVNAAATAFQAGAEPDVIPHKISSEVIFPNALSSDELFGFYSGPLWHNGVLDSIFRNAHFQVHSAQTVMENFDERKNKLQIDPPDIIHKWVVLDGTVRPEWVEALNTMLDSTSRLSLSNAERIKRDDETSVLFEMTNLHNCSPSTVTRCALVHFGDDTVSWKALTEAWGEHAKQKYMINTTSLQVINALMSSTFPPMLTFLTKEAATALSHNTPPSQAKKNKASKFTREVSQFLSLFSALLNTYFLRETHEKEMKPSTAPDGQNRGHSSASFKSGGTLNRLEEFIPRYIERLRYLFAFAYIWGFGGDLHESFLERFDEFARETLLRAAHPIEVPKDGSVFDYGVDAKAGLFFKWTDRQMERTRNLPSYYTATSELDRYNHIIDLLLAAQHPVLIVGQPGVGKSSLVQLLVQSKHPFSRIKMSETMTPTMLQDIIINQLPDLKSKPLDGMRSKGKQNTLLFIDDLNMARGDSVTGCLPSLEVLRQIIDRNILIDRSRNAPIQLQDMNFIATATTPGFPGYGTAYQMVESRVTRRFFNLNMAHPSDSLLVSIYSKRVMSWMEDFPTMSIDHPMELSKAIVQGVLDLYSSIKGHFGPGPDRPQCILTLHDLGHVLEGIFLLSSRSKVRAKPKIKRQGSIKSESDNLTARSESSVPSSLGVVSNSSPMTTNIIRLWCHEVTRVFSDRLVQIKDRQWFDNVLEDVVVKNFCSARKPEPTPMIDGNKSRLTSQTMYEEDEKEVEEEKGAEKEEKKEELPSMKGRKPAESVQSETTMSTSSESESSSSSESSDSELSSEESSDTESYEIVAKIRKALKASAFSSRSTSRPNTVDKAWRNNEDGSKASLRSRMLSRRNVSFRKRLFSDKDHEPYSGPLTTLDEIKHCGDSLSDITFSKYIIACHADAYKLSAERGYSEQSIEQLSEALNTCLSQFNHKTGQNFDLVFFKESVQHIARLTRVFAIPGGHSLLLANSDCVGRATHVRLAAHLAQCSVFEPQPLSGVQTDHSDEYNLKELHENMKRCSRAAAFHGKQVALLVRQSLGVEAIRDVCTFMVEGTCPRLYTADEMKSIAAQMTPGKSRTPNVEKTEQAFVKFMQRVKENLHVIVCLNFVPTDDIIGRTPLYTILRDFPALVTHSCLVDVYDAWTQEAFVAIAECRLRDPKQESHLPIHWNEANKDEQISLVAMAMAFIHTSAKAAVERLYCHQKIEANFFSPSTFLEFAHLMRVVANHITDNEKMLTKKYNTGLSKINEAYHRISGFKKQVSSLAPKYQEALDRVKDLVACVENKREEYIQAREQCKEQEDAIEEMSAPLVQMRADAQAEFDKVNPTYQAALQALQSLSKKSIDEVKSFYKPPEAVVFVMQAVGLLFHVQPATFENIKVMMIRENFVEELAFYDKDNMPESIFKRLRDFYNSENFLPEKVACASSSAAALCQWVRAVYEYAEICRAIKPQMAKLMQAEGELNKAKAKLGLYRVEANRVKSALEKEIEEHKQAVRSVKAIEKQMQGIEKKIAKANNMMEQMNTQHILWKSKLKVSKSRMKSSPADALLTAACASYHGPLDAKMRLDLLGEWLTRCENGNFDVQTNRQIKPMIVTSEDSKMHTAVYEDTSSVYSERLSSAASGVHRTSLYDTVSTCKTEIRRTQPRNEVLSTPTLSNLLSIREGFSPQDVLSSFDELRDWKLKDLPQDSHSIQNAIIMRILCYNGKSSWPLLIDPDQRAEQWVRALITSENIICMKDINDSYPLLDENPEKDSSLDRSNRDSPQMVFNFDDAVLDETFIHPEDNLFVIPCNDPFLNARIVEALYHGVALFITNVEREHLPLTLTPLLRRDYVMSEDGRKCVSLGGNIIQVHEKFVLFLSSSVPLSLKGEGIVPLPLGLASPIDLSVSQEGVVDLLLKDIMSVERPEFEGQKHSIEADSLLQKFALRNEQESFLQQVNATPVLLDNPALLDKLLESQQTMKRHQLILDETDYIREHLEEKRSPYISVAVHGAKLYEIICRVSVLNPNYHMTFPTFRRLYRESVQSRHRGKGIHGSPEARTQELIDASTSLIYDYASSMMFNKHSDLFALLITMEKLRMAEKVTNQELGIYVNGVDTQGVEDSLVFNEKPDWVSNKMWLDCAALENTVYIFKGLRQSLLQYSEQWQEYFKCKFVSVNPLPGTWIKTPSVFQICLLWRIIAPHKMDEVNCALVQHEMGSVIEAPVNYDVKDSYDRGNKSTPVVFFTPSPQDMKNTSSSSGVMLKNPLYEIHSFARDIGMEGKVHVITCGVEGQHEELEKALEECATNGYWLIVQNAHLAHKSWSLNSLQMLQGLAAHQPRTLSVESLVDIDDSMDESQSEPRPPQSARTLASSALASDELVHNDFRLWITTEANAGHLLPATVIQHAYKVSCELVNNFRDTLSRTYESTLTLIQRLDRTHAKALHTQTVPISVLHSLLMHAQLFHPMPFSSVFSWSVLDVVNILEQLRNLLTLTQATRGSHDLARLIYGGHCVDSVDARTVDSICDAIVLNQDSAGVATLLRSLSPTDEDSFLMLVNSLVEVSHLNLALPESSQSNASLVRSRHVVQNLLEAIGSPDMICLPLGLTFTRAEKVLKDLVKDMNDWPLCPKLNPDAFYPLDLFYESEKTTLHQTLSYVEEEVNFLIKVTQGDLTCPSGALEDLKMLGVGQVPISWHSFAFPSCISVADWKNQIKRRLNLLRNLDTAPVIYDMSNFARPDRFIQAVLQTFVRREFKVLQNCVIDVEILNSGEVPTEAPKSGVYVTGLRLHNAFWDSSNQTLTLTSPKVMEEATNNLPVMWLKPIDKFTLKKRRKTCTTNFYRCPIYVCDNPGSLSCANIAGTLEIPTKSKPEIWHERRVFISCIP